MSKRRCSLIWAAIQTKKHCAHGAVIRFGSPQGEVLNVLVGHCTAEPQPESTISLRSMAADALNKADPAGRQRPDWDLVDWRESDQTIASSLGVTRQAVYHHRRSRNIGPPEIRVGKVGTRNWLAVDWTKRDSVIARELGITQQAVFVARKKCGKHVLSRRTCRKCAKIFNGGPRAWYCPDCRAERKKEACRLYRDRQGKGRVRKLGSNDQCIICGRDYTVTAGLQHYCMECAPCAVKEIDAAQGLAYYRANAGKINPRRNKSRRKGPRPCAICGELFDASTPRKTCERVACAIELRRMSMRRADAKRRSSKHAKEGGVEQPS